MNVLSRCHQPHATESPARDSRKGAFIVLALLCLVGCLMFVCLTVDVGYLDVQKTRMQNAVDAAALAAAQEITAAVANAPPGTADPTAFALSSARNVAAQVAELNGVYVDKQGDVEFGRRTFTPGSGAVSIQWGATPANVVRVTARRTGADPTAQDGKLKLFFAGVTGDRYAKVQTSAVSFIEARDIVVVHDFSRSMNFDSHFSNEASLTLPDNQIVTNLHYLWADLNMTIGNFDFTPRHLTLTRQDSGVETSVTFKYDRCDVTTNGTLEKVVIKYASGSDTTHNVTGKSANNLGAANRDITRVTVTSKPDSSPWSQTTNGITVNATADRKAADAAASNRLTRVTYTFSDGTSTNFTWSWGAGPFSHSYSGSKVISSVRVYAPGSLLEHLLGNNTLFNVPAPNSGSQQAVDQVFEDTNDNVRAAFNLPAAYPFPGGSWNEYINHCRTYAPFASRGYRETYGGLTFANYLLRLRSSHSETPALCQARHYPFSCLKEGHQVLCDFLRDLSFEDHLGMVSYDTSHRIETTLNEPGLPYVNISANPITTDYVAINNLMKYKQANHYSAATNMGGGLKSAISLLDNHRRPTARPTIILMTDGNPNAWDSGENGTLPSGWDWNALFDYNNNGSYNYHTNDNHKRYVLKKAYEAVQKGYTIHTMSVGIDGDRDLMRAVAHLGGGYFIDVPGGFSVLDMEEDVKAAFHKIASMVPPPKLLKE